MMPTDLGGCSVMVARGLSEPEIPVAPG